MKRLLVTCEFPPMAGGQGTYFKNLWQGLDGRNFILLVPQQCLPTTPATPSDGPPPLRMTGMRIPASERWVARLVRMVALGWAMLRAWLVWRPSEIHVGQLVVGGGCALVLHQLTRTPYVVHCHGADLLEFWNHRWARPALRAIILHSRICLANSSYTAGRIRALAGSAAPVAVVNPAVEPVFFHADPDRRTKLAAHWSVHNRRTILTVGRLVERKGHDTVLRAVELLRHDFPDILYLIAGDGPWRDTLNGMIASLGIADHVRLCGAVDSADLPAIYRLAEIFVMVPRLIPRRGDVEGFGIVYLEANAAGLPVVASRSGGITDAVVHDSTGLLVDDPLSAPQVAAALRTLLADRDLRERMGREALLWAHAHDVESQRKVWRRATGQ